MSFSPDARERLQIIETIPRSLLNKYQLQGNNEEVGHFCLSLDAKMELINEFCQIGNEISFFTHRINSQFIHWKGRGRLTETN